MPDISAQPEATETELDANGELGVGVTISGVKTTRKLTWGRLKTIVREGLITAPTEEQVFDLVKNILVAGSNVTIIDNDNNNRITITSTGGGGGGSFSPTKENLYTAIKAMLVASTNITITEDDNNSELDISSTPRGAPTQAEVYAQEKDILQAGTGISITENDTDNELTLAIANLLAQSHVRTAILPKNADYTISKSADEGKVIEVSTSGGNRTLTLPNMESADNGYQLIVRKRSASNTLTITPHTGEQIDGASTYVMNGDKDLVLIKWDGTTWDLLIKPQADSTLDIHGLTTGSVNKSDFLAFSDESKTGDPTEKIKVEDFVRRIKVSSVYGYIYIPNTIIRPIRSGISIEGVAWDGESVIIAATTSATKEIYAFTNGVRDTSKDISDAIVKSAASNINLSGITSDGTSLLALDITNDAVWAFTDGARDTSKDISASVIRSANASIEPIGITYKDSTAFIADRNADAVWAFTDGARDTSKDISASVIRSANSNIQPNGLAHDGVSIFVADLNADAVWAFTDGARDTSKDIISSVINGVVGNISISGITHDGIDLILVDYHGDNVLKFTDRAMFV